jgi:hypothetical protein
MCTKLDRDPHPKTGGHFVKHLPHAGWFFSVHSLEAVCLPSGRAYLAGIPPWQSYLLAELLEVGKERAVRWKLVGQDEGIQKRSLTR